MNSKCYKQATTDKNASDVPATPASAASSSSVVNMGVFGDEACEKLMKGGHTQIVNFNTCVKITS